jgi:hypothetical protein
MIKPVAGPVIDRVHADLEALFSRISELAPGVQEPRVTIDLPATDPEPFHVFVWGTAREFGVSGALTGCILTVTYHIWVTVVATGATSADAARVANAYQAIAMQVPIIDTQLGGTVEEIGIPQVREADAWADQNGSRHAGYLLDFEVAVNVAADATAAKIIKEMNNEQK